jgi:hypothetical protein
MANLKSESTPVTSTTTHDLHWQPARSSKDLKTFTLFPNLPIEVRLKIWKFSFPTGRRVALPFLPKTSPLEMNVTFEPDDGSGLPVTLYINKEGREETLKHHSILLRSNVSQSHQRKEPKSRPSRKTDKGVGEAILVQPQLRHSLDQLRRPSV